MNDSPLWLALPAALLFGLPMVLYFRKVSAAKNALNSLIKNWPKPITFFDLGTTKLALDSNRRYLAVAGAPLHYWSESLEQMVSAEATGTLNIADLSSIDVVVELAGRVKLSFFDRSRNHWNAKETIEFPANQCSTSLAALRDAWKKIVGERPGPQGPSSTNTY